MEILETLSTSCLRKLNLERDSDLKKRLLKAYKTLFVIGVNLSSRSNYASLLWEAEQRLMGLMSVTKVTILIIDHESDMMVRLNHGRLVFSDDESPPQHLERRKDIPDDVEENGNLLYMPRRGLAQHCIEEKKTLVITEPLSYKEYDRWVDVHFADPSQAVPLICVPVFNKEDESQRVEGCVELEFKPKHYLSSNPFLGGTFGSFKLDLVTKESLEIFSN
jgi:hypothetical protein